MDAFYRHFAGATNLPTRRSGELYQVRDVFVRDGKLMSDSGNELPPGQEFKALPEKPAPSLPVNRLLRRGK